MELRHKLMQSIGRSSSPLWSYGISLVCPGLYTSELHRLAGQHVSLWNGKRCGFSLSFDVDFEEDVRALPALVELLEQHGVRASFAVVGILVDKFPAEHKLLADAGHEIVNHTYSHPNHILLTPNRYFDKITVQEQEVEIQRCDEVIRKYIGVSPVGFRTPHFGNQYATSIYEILGKIGYLYSSSTVAPHTPSFGYPFMEREGIWEFPVGTCPDHPFTTFDSWHAFHRKLPFTGQTGWHRSAASFNKLFTRLVQFGIDNGSYVNLYLDPQDFVKADLGKGLRYLQKRESELRILAYDELVKQISAKAKPDA